MDHDSAAARLASLGQPHRLALFRALVRAGPDGLPAGDLARSCAMQPSAFTFHVNQLEHAGLVTRRRRGRNILYAVAIEEMRRLMVYLTEDCCGGHPEICGGLTDAIDQCSVAKAANGESDVVR